MPMVVVDLNDTSVVALTGPFSTPAVLEEPISIDWENDAARVLSQIFVVASLIDSDLETLLLQF